MRRMQKEKPLEGLAVVGPTIAATMEMFDSSPQKSTRQAARESFQCVPCLQTDSHPDRPMEFCESVTQLSTANCTWM